MSNKIQSLSLEERVEMFDTLSLPGQPMFMHMGTSYLVHDLWNEVRNLRKENEQLKDKLFVLGAD